jgi:PAS domain S-box-containing protein
MKHNKQTKEQLMAELADAKQLISDLIKSSAAHIQEEEKWVNSEKKYTSTINGIADAIHVVDADLNILLINKAFKNWNKKLGLEIEVEGKSIYEVFPFLPKKVQKEYEKVFNTGETLITEETSLIDQQVIITETRKIPVLEKERVTQVITIIRDITEHKKIVEELKKHLYHLDDLVKKRTSELTKANEKLKKEIEERNQAEKILREQTERYLIHFSLSNDVMFSYDNQFKVLSVTPNIERILGYKPEELIGRYFYDLTKLIHPEDLEEGLENALNVLSGKTVYSNIYRFITRDGLIKYAEVNGVPIIKEGRVVAMISVARDITDRIEKEKLVH